MIATINLIRSSSAVASDNQAYRLNQPTPPLERHRKMKHLLLTTIAAVLLVGCAATQSLRHAVQYGKIEGVKKAIAAGVDVNAKDEDGGTPLLYATLSGHKEVAELLIAKGADVNAKNEDGHTPLHYAAVMGHKEIAELLIAKGADVNAKGVNGVTPLFGAAWGGRKEIAELLISSVVVLGWIGLGKADECKQTSERDDAAIHFFFNR